MHWVYYFGRGLIRVLVFPFGGWKVRGRDNVPASGPFLVVSNHLHIADPPVIAASMPLKCVLMAKADLWESGWSRFWVSNFGAFPVRRGGVDREALHLAEEWIKRGVSLIMFPEGTRSPDGTMKTALPGAVLIATRLNMPIIPVGITGSDKLKNLKRAFWHHPKITVNIGKPFTLPPVNGKLTKEKRQELTRIMMEHVADLLPPEYRGVYARRENAED
jgi:1-acyl-sn-glycerol-3-phosphate acyltransferase